MESISELDKGFLVGSLCIILAGIVLMIGNIAGAYFNDKVNFLKVINNDLALISVKPFKPVDFVLYNNNHNVPVYAKLVYTDNRVELSYDFYIVDNDNIKKSKTFLDIDFRSPNKYKRNIDNAVAKIVSEQVGNTQKETKP